MSPPSVRAAAVKAGLINAAVNPMFELIINHGGFQSLLAVIVNLAITSVILCALVAVFARRSIARGARFGVAAAAVIAAVGVVLAGFGVVGMPFWVLLVVKAAVCGVLAFLVTNTP